MLHISGQTVQFGPAHPAAHGVLRCVLTMRGEYIISTNITLGLLHRGTEKLLEQRTVHQSIAYMDRMDYVSMMSNELAYVECAEQLLAVVVSTQDMLARALLTESTRMQNHLLNIACHAGDVGCLVALLWLFEDREVLYDIVCTWCGARMHASCIVPGGLRSATLAHSLHVLLECIHAMTMKMDSLVNAVALHRVWATRLTSIGVVATQGTSSSSSGVVLRSTGVSWDVRAVGHCTAYSVLQLCVVSGTQADSMDRVLMRILESIVSASLCSQLCTAALRTSVASAQAHRTSVSLHNVLSSFVGTGTLHGAALHSIESPKGELSVAMHWSHGTCWRTRVRPADIAHVLMLQQLSIGTSLSDMVMLVGTIDIVFGSVDL
uniref:NADH dehydrogenase subunit 7 n=1 Tax=Diplonema japonicum TaxID=2508216 RepID=A0A6G5ZV18_9EUGL|nr:NADH dehydrogenase subunit 7 [Diplonema japonicum]